MLTWGQTKNSQRHRVKFSKFSTFHRVKFSKFSTFLTQWVAIMFSSPPPLTLLHNLSNLNAVLVNDAAMKYTVVLPRVCGMYCNQRGHRTHRLIWRKTRQQICAWTHSHSIFQSCSLVWDIGLCCSQIWSFTESYKYCKSPDDVECRLCNFLGVLDSNRTYVHRIL